MCPLCASIAVWVAAGGLSAGVGGVAAYTLTRGLKKPRS